MPSLETTSAASLLLFALGGSRAYGERMARHLGIELAAVEEREFEDGEHKARPLVNVRGRDVFVLHTLHAGDAQSGNDKLCRLLFFIGGLKDAAAARVTAVAPYLAYARKDRKTKPRDPVTTRYVAAMFEAVGTDSIVTMDVHNLAAYQNAFRCHAEHLEAAGMFAAHFAAMPAGRELVVVSPDAGGVKRSEQLRQRLMRMLGRPVGAAFAEKHRSGGVVSGDMLVGDIRGKDAIIIDDLISSGGTIMRTVQSCRGAGAASVAAAATHALLTGDAPAILADDALQQLIVTDTVATPGMRDSRLQGKLVVLDSSILFAEAVRMMHQNGSIAALLHG
ncbi:MAG: ribose-phosphate diphosphokinase [Noviherbaspirillum sp.]